MNAKRLLFSALIGALGGLLVSRVAAQTFTNLHNFTAFSAGVAVNGDGANPYTGLLLSGTRFYGTTASGGQFGSGTVFAINLDGTGFTNLHSFSASAGSLNTNSEGIWPRGPLVLSGNTLYGTAGAGGQWGNGTIFALNTDGTGFRSLHQFAATARSPSSANTNSDGATPPGGLVLSGPVLYGTTELGGAGGDGTVFAVNTDGTGFTNLHVFTATHTVAFTQHVNGDGANPAAGLILSSNKLYGTASSGGASGSGALFALNPDGTGFTNLHSFVALSFRNVNADGANPSAQLIFSGNTLYGTARSGGSSGAGTVFRVNSDGTGFTNLHSFTGTFNSSFITIAGNDGGFPLAGLVLSGNTLYGTASQGGQTNYGNVSGYGTVFGVNTDGSGFTSLYRFSPLLTTNFVNADGAFPSAALVLLGNSLYGPAAGGGTAGNGTIFSLPVTLRPPPFQFPPIFADFTTATIQTNGMTITPGAYFTYNTTAGGSWGIAAESFGFVGTFTVPVSGTYKLTVDHQTSSAASCPGGGYSPVDIYVNGNLLVSNFDPAQQNGGSLGEVTNSWTITATAGDNTLQWVADHLCSRYWIQGIQVTPVQMPILNASLSSNNLTLFWPASATGFVLESETKVGGVWTPVSATPVVVGSQNFVTNPVVAPLELFRLHNPNGP